MSSRRRAALVAACLVLVLGAGALVARVAGEQSAADGAAATVADLPAVTARMPWKSGAWTGGEWGPRRVNDFAIWRGTRVDTVTTYPAYDTWEQMADSRWHVSIFDGFAGQLVYGLPLLPTSGGSLTEVAAGARDDVWQAVAADLVAHGRSDSYVRVGLEANGDWFPWGSDSQGAASFRQAFQHVVRVMRGVGPDLQFVFDITCGKALAGSSDRLGSLEQLYPGDDVVDVVGCDAYDSYTTKVGSQSDFGRVARPTDAAGLLDVVEFAQRHGKTFAVPEWGLTRVRSHGAGDNPAFVQAMYAFFRQHAADLEFENYFNEPDDYLKSSLWAPTQNPRAAESYQRLWGPPDGVATLTPTVAQPRPANASAMRARFFLGSNMTSM